MPKETVYTCKYPGDAQVNIPISWGNNGPFVSIGLVFTGNDDLADPALYAELNRDQINGLIRILRKARDKHFGRDE